MTNLREEIYKFLTDDTEGEYDTRYQTDEIMKLVKKRIDKVEQDYKSKLGNWGKQQPMTDMYPKEMDALAKVRKQMQ